MKNSSNRPSSFTDAFSVPKVSHPRSVFKRDYKHTTALNDDVLTPIFLQEILPGDTINLDVNAFSRMNPTLTPVMDNIWQDVHFFYAPNRLLWDKWAEFNGERKNPNDSTDYLIPQIIPPQDLGFPLYSLADFFGLPVHIPNMETVSALPFRAYNLIVNQWYRSQELQNSLPLSTGNGPDVPNVDTNILPMLSNKRHDYFTSCLLAPQKGPSVPIPSSPSVPVSFTGNTPVVTTDETIFMKRGTAGTDEQVTMRSLSATGVLGSGASTSYTNMMWGTQTGLAADMSAVTGDADLTANSEATINALIQAFALQNMAVIDNRGGQRYTEIIRAHFGVISPDARLQRTEYLGGESWLVNMHPLQQTSSTDDETPQGNLSGNGSALNTSLRINKAFTEHGYVIGITRFRGDLSYSQGIDRMWSRKTRWDFFWPALATLPEQAVLNKEVNCNGDSTDQKVFGYIGRYDEYRTQKNMVTNIMRPGVGGSIATWNLSQQFSGEAKLDAEFISSQTPLDRTLIVPSEPAFLVDFFFGLKHARVMPTYNMPGWSKTL